MREFELVDPVVLVRRGVVDSFLVAFGAYQSRGEKVVKRHLGLTELSVDPSATFSLNGFLGAMRELQDQFGVSFMRKIGSFIFDKAAFPPGLDSLEKVLSSIDVAYNMNHVEAQGKIGSYDWLKRGERDGVMICNNPYPCSFDIGMLEAIAARFTEGGKVTHEAGGCRHESGTSCAYSVSW